jgi:hypothetical protein
MAKTKEKTTKKATKKTESPCYVCPVGKFFEMFEEKTHSEPPEFMEHFFNAHKEILLGFREVIDWRIEKLEKKAKRKGARRVKRVNIE